MAVGQRKACLAGRSGESLQLSEAQRRVQGSRRLLGGQITFCRNVFESLLQAHASATYAPSPPQAELSSTAVDACESFSGVMRALWTEQGKRAELRCSQAAAAAAAEHVDVLGAR